MRNFRGLNIWKQGMDIAKEVYSILPGLPDYEKFGMQTQLSSAAVSISSNIAEGFRRRSQKDFQRFIRNALGSTAEAESQIMIALDLGFLKPLVSENLLAKTKTLTGMMISFSRKMPNVPQESENS